ncbi:MAG: class I SAM-dependent methyltransferase, partial [Actinobacteria bacterium]|nr:class I SAM-dependent methyltransferase [Actinomycetota bacterium]
MISGKSCIICNSNNFSRILISPDYQLAKCSNCKLLFDQKSYSINSYLSIYNKNYFTDTHIKGGYYNYYEDSVVNKLTFKHRLKNIKSFIKQKKPSLLDIGCACGDFLKVSQEFNLGNVIGVDVSNYAINECLKKGLNVKRVKSSKNISQLYKKIKFDIVTLQDVIEHYQNPATELKQIAKLIKPQGLLFITTPNATSLSQRLLRGYWYHYKKGEHIYYFNTNNIVKFLAKVGFKVIKVQNTPSWVSIRYLVNRLTYYIPFLKLISKSKLTNNSFFKIPFPIYT